MAVRFSTAEVGRRSQLDYWREVVCATFFALDVERSGPSRTGFRGEITAQSLDRLRIATGKFGAARGHPFGGRNPAVLRR